MAVVSSTARQKRRLAEQKKEQARIWGLLAVTAMALIPWIVPRLPLAIVVSLSVIWFVSWKVARDGYKYRLAIKWTVVLILVHGAVLAALGYFIWPKISVSPVRVSFMGYQNETFNFSVRNGRADDVYDVQIPFLIGYDKHFEDKLSAKVSWNGEPPQRVHDDYNYCFGRKGDGIGQHVQKNEREVLIVRLAHLAPYGSGSFSITYTGGDKFSTAPGRPDFIDEPYSYSPVQGTVGVRGDYRVCKYVISTDGLTNQ